MLAFLRSMDDRRRELGMTYAVLAEKCHLSLPTVVRILSGKQPMAAFQNVWLVAEALSMSLKFGRVGDSEKLVEAQAQKKAAILVGMVQGTAGLEGQAVRQKAVERMKRKTVHELIAGSKRKLWSR